MELFEKVLQGKLLFRLTNLKHKEIFSILLYIYIFPNCESQSDHCTYDHELPQVTDLNQYLNQYLIAVGALKISALKISAISFVIALNIKHAFGCSQNSAISFVIALPGNNASAIMKLISGRQIGQKWSYSGNRVQGLGRLVSN